MGWRPKMMDNFQSRRPDQPIERQHFVLRTWRQRLHPWEHCLKQPRLHHCLLLVRCRVTLCQRQQCQVRHLCKQLGLRTIMLPNSRQSHGSIRPRHSQLELRLTGAYPDRFSLFRHLLDGGVDQSNKGANGDGTSALISLPSQSSPQGQSVPKQPVMSPQSGSPAAAPVASAPAGSMGPTNQTMPATRDVQGIPSSMGPAGSPQMMMRVPHDPSGLLHLERHRHNLTHKWGLSPCRMQQGQSLIMDLEPVPGVPIQTAARRAA